MPDLVIGLAAIPYRLRRSARARRLRITVRPEGVEVVAPSRASQREIAAFVQHHRDWVRDKVGALRQRLAHHAGPERLADGGRILFRGRWVDLDIRPRSGAGARARYADGFVVEVSEALDGERREAMVEGALRLWLRGEARADAARFIARHGPQNDLIPRALRIKEQKQLWGSCSSRGTVNLNWRLILAPAAVFEYVVVHELCHLRIRNHQPEFWQLVGRILPDFEPHRRWLRDHGHLLTLRRSGSRAEQSKMRGTARSDACDVLRRATGRRGKEVEVWRSRAPRQE